MLCYAAKRLFDEPVLTIIVSYKAPFIVGATCLFQLQLYVTGTNIIKSDALGTLLNVVIQPDIREVSDLNFDRIIRSMIAYSKYFQLDAWKAP
jgi:hypothetical protein